MKIRTFNSINNDIYTVVFDQDRAAISQSDKDLIKKYGEPEINVGGTFLAGTGNEYVLPDQFIRIVSDMPFTQNFDSTTGTFATATVTKVTQFVTDTLTKIEDAVTTLRANTDTFSGETVTNI